jgi:hypothetical protein
MIFFFFSYVSLLFSFYFYSLFPSYSGQSVWTSVHPLKVSGNFRYLPTTGTNSKASCNKCDTTLDLNFGLGASKGLPKPYNRSSWAFRRAFCFDFNNSVFSMMAWGTLDLCSMSSSSLIDIVNESQSIYVCVCV